MSGPKIPRLTELQKQDPYYYRMDIIKLAEYYGGELSRGQLRKHKMRRYQTPQDAEEALDVMVDEGFGEWEFVSKSERWRRMRQTYRKNAGPPLRKFVLKQGLTYLRGDEILEAKKVNWQNLKARLFKFIVDRGMTVEEFADKAQMSSSVLHTLHKPERAQTPQWLLEVCDRFSISRNWLFNGIGTPSHRDPDWFLPSSPLMERGKGIRRSEDVQESDDGFFTDDRLEFVRAVESWKLQQNTPFPRWTEVFDIFMSLGYRKVANPTVSAKPKESDPLAKVTQFTV